MKPLRLALVTRRYWPLVGGAATVMAHLATELTAHAIAPTVITPRWDAAWPGEMRHRGTRVIRLPISTNRPWLNLRYAWTLSAWLRQHADEFDMAYVSELKHDAAAAVMAGRQGGFCVALRPENSGLTGDCHWQLQATFGRRIKQHCFAAAAFLAPSPTVERELIAAGYARDRIHLAPSGVRAGVPRTPEARAQSRSVLAELGPDMKIPSTAPLAVFVGRLTEDKGLSHLLQAWATVAAQQPAARLWLVGDGPLRGTLFEQTESLGLSGSVLLPGVFDAADEVLQAVDLFVYPVLETGNGVALLEAMATGLPIVASDIPDNRHVLDDGRAGLLVPGEDPGELAAAIWQVLDAPQLAADLGRQAQARAHQRYSLDAMVARHVELFRMLAG